MAWRAAPAVAVFSISCAVVGALETHAQLDRALLYVHAHLELEVLHERCVESVPGLLQRGNGINTSVPVRYHTGHVARRSCRLAAILSTRKTAVPLALPLGGAQRHVRSRGSCRDVERAGTFKGEYRWLGTLTLRDSFLPCATGPRACFGSALRGKRPCVQIVQAADTRLARATRPHAREHARTRARARTEDGRVPPTDADRQTQTLGRCSARRRAACAARLHLSGRERVERRLRRGRGLLRRGGLARL